MIQADPALGLWCAGTTAFGDFRTISDEKKIMTIENASPSLERLVWSRVCGFSFFILGVTASGAA